MGPGRSSGRLIRKERVPALHCQPFLGGCSVLRHLSRLTGWLASRFEGQPHSGQVLLWVLRGVFGAVVISMAMIAFRQINEAVPTDSYLAWGAFAGILGLGLL